MGELGGGERKEGRRMRGEIYRKGIRRGGVSGERGEWR
jgi:hypothetical protein